MVSKVQGQDVVQLYTERDCEGLRHHLFVNRDLVLSLEGDMAQINFYIDIFSFHLVQTQKLLSYSSLALRKCYCCQFKINVHFLRYC